jgi:hypothetical protein
MRTPSSQKCRLDLVPPLADRFILGFPIDYGPVLLLMPFGFHLAVDTLPSGVQQAVAPGQSWLYPAFAFVPVWTSPYLPPSPASEAVNPTFGYGAPHLSARGTSTLLNSALLSAHFRLADDTDTIAWLRESPIRSLRARTPQSAGDTVNDQRGSRHQLRTQSLATRHSSVRSLRSDAL